MVPRNSFVGLQVMRDGKPELVSIVPLRTGISTAFDFVHACFLPSRRFLISLLYDHGPKFREMS